MSREAVPPDLGQSSGAVLKFGPSTDLVDMLTLCLMEGQAAQILRKHSPLR